MKFSYCSMKSAGFGILPTFMILPNNIKPKADPAPVRPSPRLEIFFNIFFNMFIILISIKTTFYV